MVLALLQRIRLSGRKVYDQWAAKTLSDEFKE